MTRALLAGALMLPPLAASVAGVLVLRGAVAVVDHAIAWAERRWRR